jgi:hypothetical protein
MSGERRPRLAEVQSCGRHWQRMPDIGVVKGWRLLKSQLANLP